MILICSEAKTVSKLPTKPGVSTPDQDVQLADPVTEIDEQIAGLLGHLGPGRLDDDVGQVHPAGAEFDEDKT